MPRVRIRDRGGHFPKAEFEAPCSRALHLRKEDGRPHRCKGLQRRSRAVSSRGRREVGTLAHTTTPPTESWGRKERCEQPDQTSLIDRRKRRLWLLQKAMLKQSNNHMVRDSLQKDVSRVSLHLQEVKEKREQQKMEIGRLTNMINQTEEQMVGLRKKYESAVQNRNERGVQLIEREEEVCIFYEKINTQEMLLRNGDVEMMALDEKIRFLKMKFTEENRKIEQIKNELPNKKALESDLVTLQIQLSQCNDRVAELEDMAQSSNKESRIRKLDGKDPSLQDLMKKMEELELRLAEKEENLLEKDFLYEHISRLSDRIRIKAENGKEDTLVLAKKMNELQKKIKDTTRKMMSCIAELSMQQAYYIKLQQETRDKEKFMQRCYTRMEQGLPPSEETEQEWKRVLREEQRRRLEKHEKVRCEQCQVLLENEISIPKKLVGKWKHVKCSKMSW
ncbi:unnamed protein product [Ranitomeya imitator]|uniref:Uncharacterized protein n=1 Tax=Ranitomeya imitator TaxID=111125 RepID=A0ABN9MAE9_9NEOB|nr:unnamed protein product [Ranitomeya imitator]